MLNSLAFAQHLPHFLDIPTGYSELGEDWLDTNNTLVRQNFGIDLSRHFVPPIFGSDLISLLNDNGVSTGPGNAKAIIDFFADILFGGAITSADRQLAIDYLNTDDFGAPSPYDDTRIREAVGALLGYAQFQEQ